MNAVSRSRSSSVRASYPTPMPHPPASPCARRPAGCLLGMDRFGLDIVLPRERRVATVAALAARGYADRIVLSHDVSCHIDWFPAGLIGVFAPDWHLEHLLDDVLPALRDSGVSDE